MTNKEAEKIVGNSPVYETYSNYPENYRKIGSNAGVYGWNWSLFISKKNDSFCVSWYRNLPKFSNFQRGVRIK